VTGTAMLRTSPRCPPSKAAGRGVGARPCCAIDDRQPRESTRMTNLILERFFDTPLSVADMHQGARRTKWCFDLYQVEWRGSVLLRRRPHLVCTFAAPGRRIGTQRVAQTGRGHPPAVDGLRLRGHRQP
jgi:hypothetical protein